MNTPLDELRRLIQRERKRRHWTIAQWQDEYGTDWPNRMGDDRAEIDRFLPLLLDVVEAARRVVGSDEAVGSELWASAWDDLADALAVLDGVVPKR